MNLNEMGIQHSTDKAHTCLNRPAHDYLRHYELFFEKIRNQKFLLVEIGISRGSSLRLWKEYFPNAEIVGIDITPSCKNYAEERISIEIGDAYSGAMRDRVVEKYGYPLIVIEDGSHKPKDQIKALELFFPAMEKGGYYIIEDILQKPTDSGISPHVDVMDYLKERIDFFRENKHLIGDIFGRARRKYAPEICYVEAHMDSIMFIPSDCSPLFATIIRKNFIGEKNFIFKNISVDEAESLIIKKDAPVMQAVNALQNSSLGMIAIVEDSKLFGVLTYYDASKIPETRSSLTIEQFCNTNPNKFVGFDDPAIYAEQNTKVRYPVVDKNGTFLGFKTILHIPGGLPEEYRVSKFLGREE